MLLSVLFFPHHLKAQQKINFSDSLKKYTLKEVVISATKTPQDLNRVGRSVDLIDSQMLKVAINSSVGELLATVPGISVTGINLNPGASQTIFIRGNNSNQSVIMVDGVRITDPSSENNVIDLSELSLIGVEKIEIVKGAQSSLYGSSAIGGIINIITKENTAKTIYAGLDTKGGIFNTDALSLMSNLKFGYHLKKGFYINAGIYQAMVKGFNATVDTITTSKKYHRPDKDDFQKLDYFSKIGFINKKTDLYISYKNTSQKTDLDKGAFRDDDNEYLTFNRNLFNYDASYKFSPLLSVHFSGGYSVNRRMDLNDSSVTEIRHDTMIFNHEYVKTTLSGSNLVNEIYGNYHTGNLRLLVGLNSSEEKMNNQNYLLLNDPLYGKYEKSSDLDSLDIHASIKSVFIHTGINGEIISPLLKGLTMDGGFRLSSHNKFGNNLNWEINPAYFAGNTLFFICYATGYNAPSLYRLYSPDKSYGAVTTRGNSKLKPETAKNLEIGLKYNANANLKVSLSWFYTKVNNLIEYVYLWDKNKKTDSLSFMDNLGDTYINLSEQQINGIELGLDIKLTNKIQLRTNFSLINGKTIYSGQDLDTAITKSNHVQLYDNGVFLSNQETQTIGLTRRPAAMAYIGIICIPTDKISIYFNNRFSGPKNDSYLNSSLGPWGALDRLNFEGYILSDLVLSYEFNKSFSLALKCENIFNTDYTEINGFATRKRGGYLKLNYLFER